MSSAVTVAVLSIAAAMGLASCAGLERSRDSSHPASFPIESPYLEASAAGLIEYAALLTRLNVSDRTFECRRVLHTYRTNRKLPILLHLFVAQGAASGCGNLQATSREVRAMQGQLADPTLRNFLDFQQFCALRMDVEAKEAQRLESALSKARNNLKQALSKHRQSISQVRDTYRRMKSRDAQARQLKQQVDELKSVEQGLSQSVKSRDAEARQLKEKLDALKSIEQDINETERREDYE